MRPQRFAFYSILAASIIGTTSNAGIPEGIEALKSGNVEAAAQEFSALVMGRLGLMYFEGPVVIRDYALGAELICKSTLYWRRGAGEQPPGEGWLLDLVWGGCQTGFTWQRPHVRKCRYSLGSFADW